MRLLTLRMKRNPEFLGNDDTIRKLANHIFKRLGNMQTFWPPSVPQNEANEDEVDRLINICQGWFVILESREALEMMNMVDYDYNVQNPHDNMNTADLADEEDEGDEDFIIPPEEVQDLLLDQQNFDEDEYMPEDEDEDDEDEDEDGMDIDLEDQGILYLIRSLCI